MLASADEFSLLIEKYLRRALTKEEETRLQELTSSSALYKETFESLTEAAPLQEQLQDFHLHAREWEAGETKYMNPALAAQHRKTVRLYRMAAAAAVLTAIGIGSYLWLRPGSVAVPAETVMTPVTDDVPPGGMKATLTLGNKETIVLDSARKTIGQGSTTIHNEEGQLSYAPSEKATDGEILMNTLATPAGGFYRVVLPDRSQVWLNAMSALTYPTRFEGNERRVTLHGEGYFEVAKATQPFIVTVENLSVKVLGTRFNIKAYANDPKQATTLLEGSVSIQASNSTTKILKPDQRAVSSHNSTTIGIEATEAQFSIAWVKGNFYFDHASIVEVMHQLERWYGVSFSFPATITTDEVGLFQGSIERTWPLSKVLRALERIGSVQFEQKGNIVTVSKAVNQ